MATKLYLFLFWTSMMVKVRGVHIHTVIKQTCLVRLISNLTCTIINCLLQLDLLIIKTQGQIFSHLSRVLVLKLFCLDFICFCSKCCHVIIILTLRSHIIHWVYKVHLRLWEHSLRSEWEATHSVAANKNNTLSVILFTAMLWVQTCYINTSLHSS